jgi:spore maturation protein CgeB
VATILSKKGLSNPHLEIEEEIEVARLEAQREVMFMIAVEAIPRYIDSVYYKTWRKREAANNQAGAELVLELELRNSLKGIDNTVQSSRLDPATNNTG